MPFPPTAIAPDVVAKLESFATRNNFPDLYKRYSWREDHYGSGFADIVALELKVGASDKSGGISLEDVLSIARWARLRNLKQIRGSEIALKANSLHDHGGNSQPFLGNCALGPVEAIKKNVPKGLGPAMISKVLRFGLPEEYGVIDSRIVEAFGIGSSGTASHNWLQLRARNDGYGPYIPLKQSGWPSEFQTWINILRFFCQLLPANCPHPRQFLNADLRRSSEWTCADVEMALFCYASQ